MNGSILITGATSGIGLAAAEALAARGAKLAIVARNEAKARQAVARITAAGGQTATVDTLFADLSSQASIRRLAAEVLRRYPRLDALVNNAGAIHGTRQFTDDGVELTWAVNHLAPFLLTTLLLDRLRESAPARVVTTAGEFHRTAPLPIDDAGGGRLRWGFARYCQSKLANILFTAELARRLDGTGVTANCLHPGLTTTGLGRDGSPLVKFALTVMRPWSRSPEKGAETLTWLAHSPDVTEVSGKYFINRQRRTPSAAARDENAGRRLWHISECQVRGSEAGI